MATAEMRLNSRIVRTGNLAEVLEWGIREDDFLTDEGKGLFRTLMGYFLAAETRGSILRAESVQGLFPMFELCDEDTMTTDALCYEVRRNRLIHEAKQSSSDLVDAIDNRKVNPMDLIVQHRQKLDSLITLGGIRNYDLDIHQGLDRLVTQYDLAKTGMNISQVLWPWPLMNDLSGGIQEDDFIVFYGRPKSMKSWVLCSILASIFQQDKPILIYTKEMTPDSILRRIIGCVAGVSYSELRMGKLTPEQEQDFKMAAEEIKKARARDSLIILSGRDVGAGNDTIPWVQGKVEKYGPCLVGIDGLYLMSDASGGKRQADHQRVMNISRDCRQMILHTKVPVLATMQANRKAAAHQNAEFDEVAYSDAIGQDVTGLFRVINEKKPREDGSRTIAVIPAGAREYEIDGFRINGNPCYDFSFHSIMTGKDIEKAKLEDDSKEEHESAQAHVRAKGALGAQRTPVINGRSKEDNKRVEKQLGKLV